MKVLRSVSVFLPLAFAAAAVWPLACADTDCTTGTVRFDATLPESVAGQAMAVDVVFEQGGQVIRMQRLPLAPGALRVSADINFPEGYPAGDNVSVSAVAKRLDAGLETPVATWSGTETFPSGCVGFVVTLYSPQQADSGSPDATQTLPDARAEDAPVLPDAPPADTSRDSGGDALDGLRGEAGIDGAMPDSSLNSLAN